MAVPDSEAITELSLIAIAMNVLFDIFWLIIKVALTHKKMSDKCLLFFFVVRSLFGKGNFGTTRSIFEERADIFSLP